MNNLKKSRIAYDAGYKDGALSILNTIIESMIEINKPDISLKQIVSLLECIHSSKKGNILVSEIINDN